MVRVEAANHGENERPPVIDRFSRRMQDVKHGVQLLLANVRVRNAGQLGLKCPNLSVKYSMFAAENSKFVF